MFNRKSRRTCLALAALVVGALALTACASSSGSTATSSNVKIDVGNGTVVPQHTNRVAVMLQAGPTYSDTANKAEGAKDIAKTLGVSVDVYYSNLDPATELSNWNTIVNSSKYGGLLIQPVAPQMCKLIANSAVQKRLLIVVMGSPLCGDGSQSGAQLRSAGTIAYVSGNNLLDAATPLFNDAARIMGSGPQKVLLVFGSQGYPTVVAHEIAWKAFEASHPDWTTVGKVYTDWTTPDAYAKTRNLLQAHPDATVVFSTYVDITAGVTKAISDAQLTDKIKVFESSGGSALSVQLLKAGKLAGSLPIYSYDQARAGVQTIVNAFKGTQPPPFIRLTKMDTTGMITPETVSTYSER
jgi:ABC-type sugar transport system substrate-binding protein